MANVDSKLHDDGSPIDREPDAPKRALRGAASGVYIGPAHIDAGDSNTAHATTDNAGGLDGSTGYRKRNGYFADNDATGAGTAGAAFTLRRTGRRAYRGDGVFGGSIPGYPAQRVGQRGSAVTQSDQVLTAAGASAAFIDKRSAQTGDGGVALGGAGRGTTYKRGIAADPVGLNAVTAGARKNPRTTGTPLIPRPVIATTASAGGTVGIDTGTAAGILMDTHADDVTGGANGLAGYEMFVFARGTDTDEDGGLVTKVDFDTTTGADFSTGLSAATTYAVYVRFKDAAGNVGPMSARATVTTHA